MKRKIFILISTIILVGSSVAQTDTIDIDTIVVKGTSYTVCQTFPEDICGEYLFHKKSNPKVLLNPNGSGYFQRHGVKPHIIKFWIVCDQEGKPKKTYGLDLNYFYTILFQYTDASVRELGAEYELLDIRIAYDEGYAIIHQERFHLFRR